MQNQLFVSIQLDDCMLTGSIIEFNDKYICLNLIDEYGIRAGRSMIEIKSISSISIDTSDEQDLKILQKC